MTSLHESRQRAEAEYRAAVRQYKQDPSRRNEDRVNIKRALLEGLQKWLCERNYGGAR